MIVMPACPLVGGVVLPSVTLAVAIEGLSRQKPKNQNLEHGCVSHAES
jgi:hypothetical protein